MQEIIQIRPQARQSQFLATSADIAIFGGAAGGGKLVYNTCMIKIYALIDPRDNKIRYVGQTVSPLYNRLACRVDRARREKEDTPKAIWIRDVLLSGNRPAIKLLEEVDDKNKRFAEDKWMKKYSGDIFNSAPAGAGGVGKGRKVDIKNILKYIGVLSDGEIADMVGVTRKAIVYHRRKLEIVASGNLSRMKPPPPMGGWNKLELPKDIIDDMGKYPDYVLAKRMGVDKSIIMRRRNSMGIPPYAETTGNNGKFKKGGYPLRWLHLKKK
jgi:hypothetical protein